MDTPEHQIAHVGIRSIDFVHTRSTGDEVNREFMVQEVTEVVSIIVVKAMEHSPGTKPRGILPQEGTCARVRGLQMVSDAPREQR